MILLDFSKPLIFIDLGGFDNKLQTSPTIKATGQRTLLLSKSSFGAYQKTVGFLKTPYGCAAFGKRRGATLAQRSSHRSVLKNGNCLKVQALKNDSSHSLLEKRGVGDQSISDLGTENKATMGLNFTNQKIYTSYSKLSEVKLLTIGIASPLRILQWAEKTLPNGKIYGEVLNANTLHHKTFKPQKGGLFCERIFGPLKDFECACGKIDKSIKYDLRSAQRDSFKEKVNTRAFGSQKPTGFEVEGDSGVQRSVKNRKYCPECDVEYTWSVIRRYQLGYIKLNSPVTHVWFLKGTPSYLSILLDFKKRHLQNVTYCTETLTVENALFQNNKLMLLDSPSKIFTTWQSLVNKSTLPSSPLAKTTFEKKEVQIPEKLEKSSSSYVQAQEKLRHRRILHQQLSPLVYSEKGTTPIKKWCQNITFPISDKNFLESRDKYKEASYLFEIQKSKSKLFSYSRTPFSARNAIEGSMGESTPKSVMKGHTSLNQSSQPFLLSGSNFLSKENTSNTKIVDVKKGSFLLSFLQLSVYYNSSLLKKQNYAPFVFETEGLFQNKTEFFGALPLPEGLGQRANLQFLKTKHQKQLEGVSNLTTKLSFLKEKTSYTPILKEISQKLPIDLYILSSLERSLHKQALVLSIKKTWEKIYKKAYFNAMQKATIIATKHSIFNKAEMGSPSLHRIHNQSIVFSELSSPYPSGVQGKASQKMVSSFYKQKKVEVYKTCARNINLVLKMIKKDFNNHILMALKNLKQPVLALKHTTQIKNSNTKTKVKVSSEIEQYLNLNTATIIKLLSDAFLKSFLLGNFFEKMPFISNNKNKNIVSNSKNNTLDFYKDLIRYQQFSKTSGFSLALPTGSLAFPSPSGKESSTVVHKALSQKGSNVSFDIKNRRFLKSAVQKSFGFLKAPKVQSSANMRKSEYQDNNHKVYNNVYVLSHRERWSSEKDWQLFNLYNSGISEYTDTLIYTYKTRLSLNWEYQLFPELTTIPTRRERDEQNEKFKKVKTHLAASPSLALLGSPKEIQEALGREEGKDDFKVNYTLSSAFYSGAGIVQQLLNELNFAELKKLDKQNRLLLYQLNKTIFRIKKQAQFFIYDKTLQLELRELCKKRDFLIRRTKLVRKFFRKDSDPSSMVLTVLPVLPPDLRPIVKMGNQIAASDLNRLYQRVIYRNDRLKKFLKDPATSHSYEMKYAQRLLQEAVDNLIQNGKSGVNSEKDSRGRLLKSLSDLLKGKQGRFRQFLLGKRVDYSGRSVIVVGPKLKLYECGIPLEMAKELYLPFLLKSILNKNYARTVIGAKSLIKNNPALAHELLRDIMQVSPVFLNRAPTLHRLGIQAFVPKLVEGRAILLHPLVCSAFNADFDGDQMAVHVPITVEARAEAWKLMLARNNIFSPATGDPLAIPSQDMVLGCYFLTTYSKPKTALLTSTAALPYQNPEGVLKCREESATGESTKGVRSGSGLFFNNLHNVLNAYNQHKIHLHALVWVKWLNSIENGSDQEEPIEIRISSNGHWQEISSNYHRFYDSNNVLISQYMATTPGRILFNLLIQKILFKKF